eukprot:767531-Hanusia_phi.AAC.1
MSPDVSDLAVMWIWLLTDEQTRIPIMPGCHVTIVPILHDNYCFLIVDEESKTCLAVDPADADVALTAIKLEGLTLSGILTTSDWNTSPHEADSLVFTRHTHWDHSGGNEAILQKFPDVKAICLNSLLPSSFIIKPLLLLHLPFLLVSLPPLPPKLSLSLPPFPRFPFPHTLRFFTAPSINLPHIGSSTRFTDPRRTPFLA